MTRYSLLCFAFLLCACGTKPATSNHAAAANPCAEANPCTAANPYAEANPCAEAPNPCAADANPCAVAGDEIVSLYDLKTNTLTGAPADLGAYRGQTVLVVNVASKCGYTPQYEGLQKLHAELKDQGFAVLGFPSNEFGGQEPGSGEQIAEFCSLTYGVDFPMFAKTKTKPGTGQGEIYRFLTQGGDVPKWNFSKYLVDADGKVVSFHPSGTTPEELRPIIEQLLSH